MGDYLVRLAQLQAQRNQRVHQYTERLEAMLKYCECRQIPAWFYQIIASTAAD